MPKKSTKNVKLVEETVAEDNTTQKTTTTTTKQTGGGETPSPDTVKAAPSIVRDEIIDIEWETIRPVYEMKQRLTEIEQYFANTCLEYEKIKANLISQITYGQNDMFIMAQTIQKSKNIDESLTYELKLPANPEEKGYFLRKDDSSGI